MEESYCEYNNIDAEINASKYLADEVGEYIENGQSEIDHEETVVTMETSRDRKWLPRIHLIGCRGVKLFLTKVFFFLFCNN